MRARVGVALLAAGTLLVFLVLYGVPVGDGPPDSTPEATTTPDPGTYPPGVDATGVENVTRLLAAHRSTSLAAGYVVVTTRTFRTTGPETNFTLRRRIAVTPALETVRVRRTRRSETLVRGVAELWHNRTTTVVRNDRPDRPPTTRPANFDPTLAENAGTAELAPLIQRTTFDLASVTQYGDETLYAFRATGYDRTTSSDDPPDRVRVTARLVVSSGGQIRTVQASVTRTWTGQDGPRRELEVITYRLVRTGVERIPPPDWIDGDDARLDRPVRRLER